MVLLTGQHAVSTGRSEIGGLQTTNYSEGRILEYNLEERPTTARRCDSVQTVISGCVSWVSLIRQIRVGLVGTVTIPGGSSPTSERATNQSHNLCSPIVVGFERVKLLVLGTSPATSRMLFQINHRERERERERRIKKRSPRGCQSKGRGNDRRRISFQNISMQCEREIETRK